MDRRPTHSTLRGKGTQPQRTGWQGKDQGNGRGSANTRARSGVPGAEVLLGIEVVISIAVIAAGEETAGAEQLVQTHLKYVFLATLKYVAMSILLPSPVFVVLWCK